MDIEALEKLKHLKDKGVITDKEFQHQKEKILNSDTEIKNNYNQSSGCSITALILIIVFILLSTFILKYAMIAMLLDLD